MSYLDQKNYRGICSNASECKNVECYHKADHVHHVWGSKHAGGPWSCVQQKHKCSYGETDDLIICKRTDNQKIHQMQKTALVINTLWPGVA